MAAGQLEIHISNHRASALTPILHQNPDFKFIINKPGTISKAAPP